MALSKTSALSNSYKKSVLAFELKSLINQENLNSYVGDLKSKQLDMNLGCHQTEWLFLVELSK